MSQSASRASFITRLLYIARDLRSRRLFSSLNRYCRGSVLDVGGADFYRVALRRGVPFDSWTVLEVDERAVSDVPPDKGIRVELGDGCQMTFPDDVPG